MRAQYDLFPYIPEDFPLLHVSQAGLDRLLTQVALEAPGVEANMLLEELYPLSGMQAGLLFHSQATGERGLYTEHVSFQVQGPFQLAAFVSSWRHLLAAHPVLRTSFVGEEVLAQAVWQTVPLPLTLIDMTGLSPEEQDHKLRAYQQADAGRGFVVQQAPLVRVAVFCMGTQHHQVLWSFHHAILDGWSVSLLLHELFVRYQALTQGRQPQVPSSRPYRDYIAWLQQQDQQAAEAFWCQELAGLSAPTPLPLTASPPLAEAAPSYGQEQVRLSRAFSQQLTRVARQLHITLNTLVQASWAWVLSRYSGQAEVLFGMVVAGRPAELVGVESLVGLCINTVPVRLRLPQAGTVADWLGRVHEHLAGVQRYSYYPLWQIQRLSQFDPAQGLFQSIVAFENYPVGHTMQQMQHSGLRVSLCLDQEVRERTNYPVSAQAVPGEQIELWVSYQHQAIEAQMVSSMLHLWQQVLQALVAQPEQSMASLPLVSQAEQGLLLEWNATERLSPQGVCVHELIEQQAQQQPDALALVQGQAHLSYGELNQRANHLAHSLQGRGVGPEILVGVCLERSLELVVALLAVLKAGGGYVPMEVSLPHERLLYQLRDAQVALVLTHAALRERLAQSQVPVLCLDGQEQLCLHESVSRPAGQVQPEHVAYVIYTSGSTGRPKGVLITHTGLANLTYWHLAAFGLTASDRATQLAGLGFDASVWELWPALAAGASVTLLDDPVHLAPEHLIRWLTEHASTISFVPTALAEQLVAQHWAGPCALRFLLTGGDQLHHRPEHDLPFQLINNYGPTEATVVATSGPVPMEQVTGHSPPDIGRAIANTQLYVLDARMQPLPFGVEGELYLGGVQVARGYLGRAELTAERFVPHPFSSLPGARLYRTGDLVRYLPDGRLAFVGRTDLQVKVRGYRIELGEIEQVLLKHAGVRECVVVAHDGAGGSKQLVAYVVPAHQQEVTLEGQGGLRPFLGKHVPDYMLPSHFLVLDALPLTTNGKVDRQALPPARVALEQEHSQGSERPDGPLEELLAGIWQELLHVPHVSSHDAFFALGGHSLLAMQVVARIRQQLGIEVAVRTLFEAPTLAELAARVQQELRGEPRCLLPALRPSSVSTPAPLSFAQERLWFLEQLEPGRPTYHVPLIVRLHGPLHVTALAASLRQLEARQQVLRLYMAEHKGQAVQGLLPIGSSPLLHLDLSELAPSEREAERRRLARHEAHQPFELQRGPLWRACLLRLEAHEWMLLLTLHHLITDGWSMPLLLQELGQCYRAQCQGVPADLPLLPVQYADYARWQRQWMQGEYVEAELAYWRERLAGLEPLQLPTDHARPAVQTTSGAQEGLHLCAPLHQQLVTVSREEGVTLFMTLLAGWLLVLRCYSGQSDLAVGTPIANRSQAELEGLIGLFVNTLVVRCTLEGQARVRDLLAHVREVTLGAYSHQEVPFEHVVEALQPQRDLSQSPLFQVMFSWQPMELHTLDWQGLTLQIHAPELEVAKFDLTLAVAEHEQGLEAVLEYNRELFEPETIQRMLGHWQQALHAIVEQPEQRLAELSLLSERERALLLEEWNATQQIYPQDMYVHALFEQQAQQRPDAIALVQEEAHLSYGELNQRANHLAHSLQGRGVGPEILVGVCLERSLELVVALLAVLKAGGGYVPMEPSLPQERLCYQLHDAHVRLVLTQAHLRERLAPSHLPVLCLDGQETLFAQEPLSRPQRGLQPEHVAYVIYTSGSTGQPKGVLITHQSLTNLVGWHLAAFGVGPRDRATQLAGLGFDASVWEVWPALAAGASVTLLEEEAHLAPEHLGTWLSKQAITVSFVPTPLAQPLLEQPWPRPCALRVLLTGGDRLQQAPKQQVPFQLVNNYGPTEATVVATSGAVATGEATSQSAPAIGRAIANTQLYVLDARMQPVPLGVVGELYLGGVQLARGYLGRAELTAERFVPHPFSSLPGARLYRTGDLVRYLPDGRLAFVGRTDWQVKVRGYRIELGEIEQTLRRHGQVRECAVVAREDAGGSKQVVAYVVPTQQPPVQGHLRSFLAERLPDYMLPSHVMVLDHFPLTTNGKVDRRALPSPEPFQETPQTYTAPRTSVEQCLTGIWRHVLRLAEVGIHDNFFALGGDSILSLSLIAQARQAGLHLTVKQLFQAPTIAQVSPLVTQLSSPASASQPLSPPSTGRLPLTAIQRWFFEQRLANPHHWNQAVLVQVPVDLSLPLLEQAVQWVFAQHDVFGLRFEQTGPDHWQASYLPAVEPLPFSVVQVPELAQAEQAQWIEQRASQEQTRLHLSAGPLARALLLRLAGTQPARLLLVCHHLVVDTVSWRIVLDELSQSYARLQEGQPLHPLPATSSYHEWAQHLLGYVQSDAMQQQAAFWLDQALPGSGLPVENSMGANQVDAVAHIEQHLGVQDTQALLHQVPQRLRASVEEVLLAALALSLHDGLGCSEVLIALEGHGREELGAQLDLSRTVGWFTSLFPLLLEVGAQPEPLAVLRQIKRQLRQLPQRGIGYGLLRYLHPDPHLRGRLQQQPQPAVSFNYLGQFDQVLGDDALFSLATESPGWQQAPENQRVHQLEVLAWIVGEQLHLSVQYNAQLHHRPRMEQVGQSYLARVQHLIALAQVVQADLSPYIPEDFPLLGLSQEALERLLAQVRLAVPGVETNMLLEELYPLSGMQAGLLFHSQTTGEQGLYTEHVSFQVEGPFQFAAFVSSWHHLLAAHPILRTSFVGEEMLAQAVWQTVPLPLTLLDVTHLSPEEQDQQVRAYHQADARRGFVIQQAPLVRMAVLRVGTEHHHILWSFHHAILDGWSVSLLLHELFARYQALVQGTEPGLPASRPYRDYIAWLQQQDQQAAEAFWSGYLQGLTAPTPLPLTTTHSLTQPSYGQQKAQLSKEGSQHLQTVARRLHLTLNTLIQASWAWVLSRYSGQAAVLFGMVVAGRPAELVGVESLVGLCINTVPVRLRLPQAGTVADWLGQVQEQLTRVQHYSYCPLWQIQRLSQFDPGQALFESIVAFENYPVERTVQQMQHSGLCIRPWLEQEVQERTNYPVAALAVPGDQVELSVSYQHQAIEAQLVSSMLEFWQQVLHVLVEQPEQPIATLPLVSQAEQGLLREWNARGRLFPQDRCVHELIEQQAQQQPDALALVQGQAHLSYGDLNQRASRLAHRLQRAGVAPEVLVGVCLERSPEWVVALLAVLKAGGGYVPMEPSLPHERLLYQLRDAQVALVLTHAALRKRLAQSQVPVLCLDGQEQLCLHESVSRPAGQVQPEHVAYVIYTSGSTGRPKGVLITHTGLSNLTYWHLAAFGLTASDRATQLAGLGFDASVWELWPALVAGASVTLLDDSARLLPEQLARWLTEQASTISFVPTPLAEHLLEQAWPTSGALRILLTGGDRLHHRPERDLPFQLVNNYGPTEATVVATSGPVPMEQATGHSPPDIGRAIANTQLHVLDARMQPLPFGVEGELYLGGVQVARGYLRQAELTAERFVPHPFSSLPGARLYRTGDLVRYLPDGRLAFVGRTDWQVKVRGYRIELGEIEQVLLEHPAVQQAVVVAQEDDTASRRLVAYVVLAQPADRESQAMLRSWLEERLPQYMVPSHVLVLDALPLTASGKVDRRALPPAHLAVQQGHSQSTESPQDPLAQLLAGIWQEVLHVRHVSFHDTFFALGGHSLLAMQVVARIREQLGIEVAVRTLFEAPTLAELAARVQQELRGEPRCLLPALRPSSVSTPAPLSFAQERLWFLEQLEPGRPTYHVPLLLRLHGPLNAFALQASLRQLEARQQVLRLYMAEHEGQVVQGLLPVGSSPLLHLDLSELAPSEREAERRRLARHEAHQPFELQRGPLWRARLLRLEAHEWVLLLTLHHLITDGWSMPLLLQEVGQCYRAQCQGVPADLPLLPVQYADYARWQRQWMQGEYLHAEVAYWRERLVGLEPLQLPTDHARPAVQTTSGAQEGLHLCAPLHQQLVTVSREEGVTLFMTLLAGWLLVLRCYSGQSDLAVGTPIANRSQAELEGLIGLFVNTLVVRCTLEGQARVRDLLAHVREVTLGAYSHQEVPFEHVVEALQPQRDLSQSPLFQVMFSWQAREPHGLEWPGVSLQIHAPELEVAKFDLTLAVAEHEQGLEAVLEYNRELFEPETIQRMLGHWQQALHAIVEQPEQRLAELSLLSERERALLLEQWNATERLFPQGRCVHELIEQQAQQQPDAMALVHGQAHLSYGELNQHANHLAHYLQCQGVGPESLVGVCLPRSLEVVIAHLAVLKAGGGYVPMEPSLPQERLYYQLHDAHVRLVLTQAHLRERLAPSHLPMLCLDGEQALFAQEPLSRPQSGVQPEHVAYVIYTSGSTGQPKGVLITHQSLTNLVGWHLAAFGVGPRDRATQLAGLGFDASVWEVWPALVAGASVTLLEEEAHLAPEHLGTWLSKQAITVSFVPTPLAQPLLEQPWPGSCALRVLLTGGDRLQQAPKQQVPFEVVNNYGPTEATVVATSGVVATGEATSQSAPAIGRAIANTQLYVLDARMQPVPLGAVGELYLGGVQLARGYLGRAELTAERFVPHPFSSLPGARLYRTGDLVRYLPDGRLAFVGRTDWQVKVRGYRIELGEIEQTLRRHGQVRECAVVAREDAEGSKQVVAYVVPTQQQPVQWQGHLRSFLAERLPDYMLPSCIVVLDHFPLTAHGKVDRRALPSPKPLQQTSQTYTAPRTSVEQCLTGIWRHVLRLAKVGIHDNFFALGGDSILSLSLIAQARQAGLCLTVKQLFQAPTIAQVSPLVTPISSSTGSKPQEQARSTGRLPLTAIQRWFFEQRLANPHHWNQAVLVQVPVDLSLPLLEQAVQWVFAQHDVFGLRFEQTGPDHWQASYLPAVEPLPFSVVQVPELAQAEQAQWIEQRASQEQTRLHLSAGPLARALLFRLAGTQPARLLLVCHHLVIDTVSWRIVLDELSQSYERLQEGQPLLPLPTSSSYHEWAQCLLDYVQSEAMQQQAAFWLDQALPTAGVPLDEPTGGNREAWAERMEQHLSVQDTQALLRHVPQHTRASVEEVLLAALALACSDCFGSTCLTIDLEGHGREALVAEVDLSRTVGWCTSLFPLRLEVGPQPEPLAALRQIKRQLRQLPQRGIGYGLLRYLHPDPQLRARLHEQPQPAISFNYLGQFDQVLGADALFSLAPESPGRQQDPQNQRMHQLDIVALIVGEQLHLSLQYGAQLHHAQTMLRLTQSYLARLQHLIALAQATQGNRCPYIPEDFPLLHVSQAGLDRLLTQVQPPQAWASKVVLEELYPLVGMQAGLLFHSQAAGEQGLYTQHISFQVEGPFQLAAFVSSWHHLLAAHPILRTSFVGEEMLAQAVWQTVPLPLTLLDVTHLSPEEQDQQVRAYHQADARRGFVIQQAPLVRVAVLRVGTEHHHILWSFHHAILDGWSVSLLLHELFARYQALVQGTEPGLPASRPYRDYIAWLQQQDHQAAAAFWGDYLQGLTAPTPLPLTTTHSLTQPSYGQQKVRLSKEGSQHLQTVARRLRLTLNTLIQASWAWVLSRYSGQAAVLFGMVVAGRPAELVGVESLVGLCINTVPVRLRLPQAGTVADWLGQVQEQLTRVQHYSYCPLWQIQRLSQFDPGQALFESIVAFENYPVERTMQQMQHSGLCIRPWLEQEVQERTNYPVAALAVPDEQVQLAVSYQQQAIDAQLVSSMLHLWQQVLQALVAQPEPSMASLPLLSEDERTLLLVQWNATERLYPQGVCVHELFEQQAQQQPDAIALVQAESHLSYGQLNQRANQLAPLLHQHGVGPEVLVGLCLERSLELVIAQLAVLKAGGGYVPMEPSLPQERLLYQLRDAQVALVLTQAHLRERLAPSHLPVLCLDGEQDLGVQPPPRPQSGVQPEHVAYVIYTSGSTGRPKGVLITHTSLANLVSWHLAAFGVGARDRATQLAGLGFDASVWEVWPALVAGASVTLLEEATHLAPEQLGTWLTKQAITVSFVPTPLAQPLLEQPWPGSCALRVLLTGGDRLQQAPKQQVPFEVVNNYGPTEATVVATSGAVAMGEAMGQSAPAIGRAIANTQLYVLDARMQLVPIGVEGELYVGGVSLARGYLGRAELTAERFVPHPFSSTPGARLYRTGDLVRYRRDGNLEFVGRDDFQVKVRGYRIELGEIEHVLLKHAGVRECVVVAHDGAGGSKQLVAYVVPAQQQPVGWLGELRSFLAERLPDYMLPWHFMMLDCLPLTAHGKVDRQALLAHRPEEGTQQQPHEQQRPRDQIELQLLHIWERVLERGPISLTDNFFHLGGHSLTALRLQSQMQSEFQRQLPLGLLLQHPTIGELAHILRQQIGYVRGPSLVPLQPHGSHAPFFCVHPGGGSVFCYLDLVRHLGMSYPVYGLQAPEVEEGQAIASVERLAAHYIAALQTVQPEGPYSLGGWSAGGIIAYEMACQLRYQGHDVALLCLFDSRVPSVQHTQQRNQALEFTAFLVASGFHEQEVSCLTEEEQLRAAYEVFKQELMLPDGLDLAYVQHFMQIQFDIEAAIVAYEPPRSDQHITLLRVEQAMEHTAVRPNRELEPDRTYGWNEVTTVSVDIHRVPGTHNEMFREPYVKTVASTLRACLEKRV